MEGNNGMEEESTTAGAGARIKALDRLTASNLRKGQVISKVSDIVRELVENALDANASTIQVYLEKFGRDKIEVRDNGHGLDPDDVNLIFRGGHTSKLLDTSNLSRGKYLGFRGEALSAMCAVGNVTLISKSAKQATGIKYKFDPLGNVISEGRLAHGVGTTVTVEKLFENIPVRRQRLENAATGSNEIKEIEAFLKTTGIANPTCSISLFHNTTLVLSKPKVQTFEQALVAVLGHNIAKRLQRVGPNTIHVENNYNRDENESKRTVELYLPVKPVDMRTMSYTSNKMTMIFCNQKRVYIREFEKLIHRYVTANVEKPQPADQRRFPVSAMCIRVPHREVDFNLDMDKTKVHLVHKNEIRDTVENMLIKFYGVDLRETSEEGEKCNAPVPSKACHSEEDEENPLATLVTTVQKEQELKESSRSISKSTNKSKLALPNTTDQHKDHIGVASVPVTPVLANSDSDHVAQDISRQNSIAVFLHNIPSTSTAFCQSPTKMKNIEPVTVEFPISKPTVDTQGFRNESETTNKLGLPKNPGKSVVANFEISVNSQELFDFSEEPIQKPKANKMVTCTEKSTSDIVEPVDKLQNWLHGRMVDKFGDIIESVVTVQDASPKKDRNSERFRSALLAGVSNPASFNRAANGHTSQQFSAISPSSAHEPPAKRVRNDISVSPGNQPRFFSPFVPGTPRMPTHRQSTLDSLTNWPTSTGGFSQAASKSVVGVRIPIITPKRLDMQPARDENNLSKHVESTRPRATRNEHQNRLQKPASIAERFRYIIVKEPTQRLTEQLQPKVHREILGGSTSACGQLYYAQTYDSIGVFCPLNMIEYFPNESRECWSGLTSTDISSPESSDSGTMLLSKEDVSKMFQQFVDCSKLNKAPISGKIFHVISRLPYLTQVIIS